jgi:hypothetical protein
LHISQIDDQALKRHQFPDLGRHVLIHFVDVQGRADHPSDLGENGYFLLRPFALGDVDQKIQGGGL